MTEDDTFNKLKQLPIDQLIYKWAVDSRSQDFVKFLKENGWTRDEFYKIHGN